MTSSDIAQKLRDVAKDLIPSDEKICLAAADEIDRLYVIVADYEKCCFEAAEEINRLSLLRCEE